MQPWGGSPSPCIDGGEGFTEGATCAGPKGWKGIVWKMSGKGGMGFAGEGTMYAKVRRWKIVWVAEMMKSSLWLGLSDCEVFLHVILRNLACYENPMEVFFNWKKNLFIWLHRVSVAARGIFVEACRSFVAARRLLSSCGVWVFLSLVVAHAGSRARGLCSCGAWGRERVGSVVCSTQAL